MPLNTVVASFILSNATKEILPHLKYYFFSGLHITPYNSKLTVLLTILTPAKFPRTAVVRVSLKVLAAVVYIITRCKNFFRANPRPGTLAACGKFMAFARVFIVYVYTRPTDGRDRRKTRDDVRTLVVSRPA